MRIILFASIAVATLLLGCSETPQHMGGPVDNDQNVLTGGPITGTTIQDLPQSVKEKLKERAPHAEIASILRTKRHEAVVYDITFVQPDKNPEMFLRDDGKILAALGKIQP